MKKYMLVFLWLLSGLALSGCNQTSPTCTDDESLIDGKCVINRTEFEQTLYDTAQLDNYSIDLTVTLGEEISISKLKFAGNKSMVEAGNTKEYFETVDTNTYRYYKTESGYQRETLSMGGNPKIAFYAALKETDFTLSESRYLLNFGTYPAIEAFVKSYDMDATFSNFELSIDTYITQIKLDIIVDDLVYKLTFQFYDYNQTVIEVPNYVS